ncbi:ATP-binding protein [Citrobacter braakii]|nr:ATP-binding protein [Citrobacter braakii]
MIKKKSFSKKKIQRNYLKLRITKLRKAAKNSIDSAPWDIKEKLFNRIRLYKYPNVLKRKKTFKEVSNKKVIIKAPKYIDYYYNKDKNIEVMNKFLEILRECVGKAQRKVFIDFSETKLISAAAMLSFLAEVDILLKKNKLHNKCISFSHPKDEKIESILKQVGFYDLLKKGKRDTKEYEDVTFWKYTSGACSEPMLASEMIADIRAELESKNSRKLYRGFVEAMSNSVEHAYIDDIEHSMDDQTAKWWTFAGIKDNQLIVVICDKGVGIPSTLPRTQGMTLLESFFNKLGVSLNNVQDSSYIKAAATLSRTRTGQANRGKGLTDITSVIDSIGSGVLSIFSNKGRYMYKGNQGVVNDLVKDYKTSVCGTIVEWTIPIEVEGKENDNN